MTDDGIVTNRMLLEHIQAGDNSLREELKSFKKEVKSEFRRLEEKMDRGFADVDQRFVEARHDRENIHEDLEATIRMQAEHESQLAVLTGRPSPENY